MTDHYAVIGNPVAHSKSPQIHAAFAASTGQDMQYGRVLAPLDGFAATVERVRLEGLKGANVTVPFKEQACALATQWSPRARTAGAANTLRFDAAGVFADNTDGAGLVADLTANLGLALAGRRLLLVGAGGAARGVLQPLVDLGPSVVTITNRTWEKAQALAGRASPSVSTRVDARRFDDLAGEQYDLIINATSASLAGEVPSLPPNLFASGAMAYDMMYGKGDTPFMTWSRAAGATRVCDGLGMLVEQAAEAFFAWRGVRPSTKPVLAMLRASA